MKAETVKKRLASRLSIPSLPAVLQKLDELLRDPNVGMQEVGALVGQDPPLAAKVLRIANSSYYGLREPVVTIEHAAGVLGINALRNMIMEATMFKAWAHLENNDTVDIAQLWRHSILSGRIAQRVASSIGGLPVTKEEMYVAGLLHDIGRLALLDAFPRETLQALELAKKDKRLKIECEREVIGLDHAQVGGLIARRWSLPKPATFAILNHHSLQGSAEELRVVAVVSIADQLARAICDSTIGSSSSPVDRDLMKVLKIDMETVLGLAAEFRERLSEIEV